MGYYCTVPQCTSLAGKTKNVKFHRFPRDTMMADKWNLILKRGKPYTKYSKVCSLHFTQGDYNVTAMGQWKTLSKDAIPSQNLPKLNPDGTPMVIRKSRSIKYKEPVIKKEIDVSDRPLLMDEKYSPLSVLHSSLPPHAHEHHDNTLPYRLQSLNALADNISPNQSQSQSQSTPENKPRPDKQDAVMQTDPQSEEEDRPGCSDTSESFNSEQQIDYNNQQSNYERNEYPKDYTKPNENYPKTDADYTKPVQTSTSTNYTNTSTRLTVEDYLPQTNEEYNKEAEKYALERKTHYDKEYKAAAYSKIQDMYDYGRDQQTNYASATRYESCYATGYDPERSRMQEEEFIKQEDLSADDEKYLYERSKEALEANNAYEQQQRIMQQRLLEHVQQQVKTEPDIVNGAESVMQPQGSPYYQNAGGVPGYYAGLARGPELLMAKQNALAAHSQLWQNTMKRPFFYSDTPHYNGTLHRYEDLSRILQ